MMMGAAARKCLHAQKKVSLQGAVPTLPSFKTEMPTRPSQGLLNTQHAERLASAANAVAQVNSNSPSRPHHPPRPLQLDGLR
jgi:hypothetical protein